MNSVFIAEIVRFAQDRLWFCERVQTLLWCL